RPVRAGGALRPLGEERGGARGDAEDGAARRSRTPNLQIRSLSLYPVELWLHRALLERKAYRKRRSGGKRTAGGRRALRFAAEWRALDPSPLFRSTLVAGALAFGACAGGPAAESPPRPNVLVVLVDTLRADRLSLYGYGRETSPHLDRFAR